MSSGLRCRVVVTAVQAARRPRAAPDHASSCLPRPIRADPCVFVCGLACVRPQDGLALLNVALDAGEHKEGIVVALRAKHDEICKRITVLKPKIAKHHAVRARQFEAPAAYAMPVPARLH